jgi:hypothetical protein
MEKFNKFGNNSNNKFGNNNNKFGINNNNNMANNNDPKNRQITPYKNPYEGRLHHVSDAEILGEYHNKCDVDDYDDFIRNKNDYSRNNNENDFYPDDDDCDDIDNNETYDYNEVFGRNSGDFEGVNPGCNVTNNLSYVDRNTETPRKQTCYDELYGKCTQGPLCKFSHTFKDLSTLWKSRNMLQTNSKYKDASPTNPSMRTPMVPTTILRRDNTLQAISTDRLEPASRDRPADKI